jgi:alpha-galactosidase
LEVRLVFTLIALAHATALAGALAGAMPGIAGGGEVATREMARAGQWVAGRFERDEPFFSFAYAGRPSADLLKAWKQDRTRQPLDDKRTQHTLTYTDPETGVVLRCVGIEYADFPTVEWTLYFRNGGDKATPILADIRPLDICLEGASSTNRPDAGMDLRLHHHVGSPARPEDYRPLETVLKPGVRKRIAARGGRPSNSDLPYFNLELPGGNGLIVVVGWPGQWAAEFACDKDQRLHIRAGQELTRLSLLPGEEIRTPLMVLQFWEGDRLRSQNIWRRWMLAHNVPRPGGKLPPLFLSASSSYYFGTMTRANTASQKLFFDRYREEGMPLDYWWMDAGWYPCNGNWWNTGSWEVDTNRFPKGLREVSDHVQANGGTGTIVWFEPERVRVGPLTTEHAGWLLHAGKQAKGGLLNLGNPEAWSWLVNHVDKLIVDERIGLYRQDFNMDPLAYWHANDAPDRQGITEIKHVVGYLAFWDELRRRHPDMLIDTCASGGRRNDLETLRRAVPLLRSDYWTPGAGQQCQTYGIASWMPYFGASMQNVPNDVYLMRSHLLPLPTLRFDMRKRDTDYTLARRVVDQWRQFGRLYLCDYYPLTPYSLDEDVWMAWQFDSPESGEGLVQAFRRKENAEKSVQFKLRGLDEHTVYTVVNLDVSGSIEVTGRDLMNDGLAVVVAEQPGAAFVTYRKK